MKRGRLPLSWVSCRTLVSSVAFGLVSAATALTGGRGPLLRFKLRLGMLLLASSTVAGSAKARTFRFVPQGGGEP